MANYYGSACDSHVVDPECSVCIDNYELAGIGAAAFIHKTYLAALRADVSNASLWLAGRAAGKLKILPNIRGDFDGGTPKEGPGYGRRTATYVGSDFKGKLYDGNYIDNAAFWDSIMGTSDWHIAICTESQVHISANPVTISAANPIADDIGKIMEWVADYKFFQKGLFLPETAPNGIFDCSFLDA